MSINQLHRQVSDLAAWLQVVSALDDKPVSIPAVSGPLRQCLLGLSKEMDTSSVPLLSSTRLAELRPFTQRAVKNLPKLSRVLDIRADAHFAPHSKAKRLVRL